MRSAPRRVALRPVTAITRPPEVTTSPSTTLVPAEGVRGVVVVVVVVVVIVVVVVAVVLVIVVAVVLVVVVVVVVLPN